MKIAIYSRKSVFTGKGESIGNQIDMCKEYAMSHFDSPEFCIYEDEGFSAKNTDRPMFQKMLSDMSARHFDVLICYRLDRISRSVSDFSGILDMLQDKGIDFVSLRESFDTSTPMGRAMIYIASVFAQLERETIAERIRDNKLKLAHLGRWQGGFAPYGYDTKQIEATDDKGKKRTSFILTENPETSAVVKLIFEKYVEFESLSKLERFMLAKKIPSPTGKEFSKSVLRQILINPAYASNTPAVYDFLIQHNIATESSREAFDGQHGLLGYSRTSSYGKTAKRKRQPHDHWIVAVSKHKGLVDGDVWVRIQRNLLENKEKYPRWDTSNVALLSGLLRCGKCGAPIKVQGNRRTASGEKNFYYVCSRKARSNGRLCDLKNLSGPRYDLAFVQTMKDMLDDKSKISSAIKKSRKKSVSRKLDAQTEVTSINKTIANNDKAINKLVIKLSESTNAEMDTYLEKAISELTDKNVNLKSRIAELSQVTNGSNMDEINLELLQEATEDFINHFSEKSLEDQRVLVRRMVKRVIWDGEQSTIELYSDKIAPL